MRIGIVTKWFERGAAYVSKIYANALSAQGHEVFIYSRGGENTDIKETDKWKDGKVTVDDTYNGSRINNIIFYRWIKRYNLDVVFFNEQNDMRIVVDLKEKYPSIKIGAYVDYYTENTRIWFNMFDFVICNTKRHMQAMEGHPQKYYISWGTDINLYKPTDERHEGIVFFHSAGMSTRKGTDILVNAYIHSKFYKRSKLIIHTQLPIKQVSGYTKEELAEYNIEIIEKTVTAPGLYYLGDIYVYPTRLDGLGLTMYEAVASGMPVITTDFPPMNEAIKIEFGKLVKVKDFYCRADAYYYPMAICDENDLIECMRWYIDNPNEINRQKYNARKYAENNFDIFSKSKDIAEVFENSTVRNVDKTLCKKIRNYYRLRYFGLYHFINSYKKTSKILHKIHK